MGRRRGYKAGDWLVQDEESGFVEYASNVGIDYYGVLKRKDQMDAAHPQEFVKALADPYPVDPTSPPMRNYDLSQSVVGFTIGDTSLSTPQGAALHLYRPGIGNAIVGYDFFVY